MKKILGITILFMTLFMCMCCDPDPIEPVFPDAIETAADLDGLWEFVSFQPDPGNTIDCSSTEPWKFTIDFDGSTQTCIVTDLCGGEGYSGPYIFEILTSTINIRMEDGITSYRGMTFNPDTDYDPPFLYLKLRFSGLAGTQWFGILTLEKTE
jgi:hypothetical protein